MADLASTRVFGKLTVMHEAIVKANAEITGNITASKFIGDGSQLTALPWGQLTGAPATATRWPAWGEVTGKPAQATRWPSWSEVTSKPSTFAPSAHTHSLSQITDAGNLAALNTNASTSNFLRGDGTWATPPNTNTTYSEITTAEIDAGTASTLRTITGRRMKYALDKKADTSTQVIAGTGLSGGGTLAANRTLSVNYGTAAGTAAQGNDSRIVNAVPNTRTITAGNGLSGGGSLAGNRTISLGTPSTITGSTSNSATTSSHTHAINLNASDVGAVNSFGGNWDVYDCSAGDRDSGTDHVLILCPVSGNHNVLGSLWIERTSGHHGATKIDILYSSSTGTARSAQLSVLQNGHNEGTFSLVEVTVGGTDFVALRRTGTRYFLTSAFFSGHTTYDGVNARTWYATGDVTLNSTVGLTGGYVVYGGSIEGNGSGLTNLNANNVSSGTISTARLPAAALIGDTTYSAGTGLSLSGTTFNVNYGTSATTAAAGNDSRLSNSREWTASTVSQAEAEAGTATTARKWTAQRVRQAIAAYAVPTSRTITAGTGLTGGGDLTANRTLSVSYGTTAGTAAQGNDSRLSNSREWTASVVSQAEAEAGTATTARKWTAQRVRQAIDALSASSSRKVIAGTGLSGGGDLTADRTLSVNFSSSIEAMLLTNTTTAINPARLGDALKAYVPGLFQTWQDMTTSRALNTTYTNTMARPIVMMIGIIQGSSGRGKMVVGGVDVFIHYNNGAGEKEAITTIVPAGETYRYEITAGIQTLEKWVILQ